MQSDDVRRDMSWSSKAFIELVWPALGPKIGNGKLVPVELVSEREHVKTLDTLAGIDAWHVIEDRGMRGIATRVQACDKSWRTFTIRFTRNRSGARTEYEKRVEAINGSLGMLYPHLTVQAYITKDRSALLEAAVVLTEDLFAVAEAARREDGSFSENWRDPVHVKTNPADGNLFVVVKWDALAGLRFIRLAAPVAA